MCGICGIFSFGGKSVLREDLLKMNGELFHRGPDEEGSYCHNNIGLGSRRLSIIDLKSGRQPIHNEDKRFWVVFNGEIYNYKELRFSLEKKNHRFYTNSDTECLVHLYEDEGPGFVNKLDGMFAFAIWDEKGKRLFLARDPMGKKPLYYSVFDGKFVFASEPKAILSLPGRTREIEKGSLSRYFFYGYVPSPDTIFKGINRLPAGYLMKVDSHGQTEVRKYWDVSYKNKVNLSFNEAKKETLILLEKAVKKRLIADVPVGVFLSGGIDSSLITALIPTKKVEVFTIGFEDKSSDESENAQKIANHLGLKQNLRIFSDREVASLMPKILSTMDEPMADVSILPTWLLSSFTRKKVKVALSGDGGDEDFGGYPKYIAHFIAEKYKLKYLPGKIIYKFFNGKQSSFFRYVNEAPYRRNQYWISSLTASEVENLTEEKLSFAELEKYHNEFDGNNIVDEALYLDQKLTLADEFLVKVDRASMANSLEVRCPFLDKALVKFSASLSVSMKIRNFQTKAILREIAKDLLPEEITKLPKKGFGIPLKKWLSVDLMSLRNEYLSKERIMKEGILNYKAVNDFIERQDYDFIWKLLIFEIWMEKWLKN